MTLSKKELIQKVSDQFVSKLNKEYFQSDRIQNEVIGKAITTQDPSVLTRIFDKVELDNDLTKQFFESAMSMDDPTSELLDPLVKVIGAKILDPNKKELNATLVNNISQYENLSELGTESERRDIYLRAIVGGCNSILTGQLSKDSHFDANAMTQEQRDAANDKNHATWQKFASKISTPFEDYSKKTTKRSLFPTLLQRILSSLSFVVSLFVRNADKNINIEQKIGNLQKVITAAKTELAGQNNMEPLIAKFDAFNKGLNEILDVIEDKKDADMPFEDAAISDFETKCANFTRDIQQIQMNDTLENDPQLAKSHGAIFHSPLIQKIIKQAAASLPQSKHQFENSDVVAPTSGVPPLKPLSASNSSEPNAESDNQEEPESPRGPGF